MVKIRRVDMFNRKIIEGSGLHIVRVCAEWSGPCQIMGPIYEEMHTLFKTVATFYKIDIDEAPLLKEKLGVNDLPAIFFYRDGEIIDRIIGLISRDVLIAKLENAIK